MKDYNISFPQGFIPALRRYFKRPFPCIKVQDLDNESELYKKIKKEGTYSQFRVLLT